MSKSSFKKIFDWNSSRNLFSKELDMVSEVNMLMEEFTELIEAVNHSNEDEIIDALADMIVIATGTIYKLGYDTDKVMDEVIKEISSRTGSLNAETGKWEKDKSEEAQAKWYKANFHSCLIRS